MVYYTDSPKINRRLVAGYYLFLCLVGFAVLLGPTGAGIPITIIGADGRDHELAVPGSQTDPAVCDSCHSNQYDNWSTTAHATHMGSFTNGTGDYVTIGSRNHTETFFNASCAECHTSGYNTTDKTYDALGVNCFACHDAAGSIDYNGTNCENCHRQSGPTHPNQAAAYQNSKHANSLADLRASGHAGSSCMHCMSTEGFIHQDDDFDPNDLSTNPIGCPACHSVHSEWSEDGPSMIRAVNATELCGLCHVGSRHTTYNIFYGGPHHLAGVQCIDCHGYDRVNVSDPNSYFLNHTFVVKPDLACGQSDECHEGMEEWALNQLESIQSAFDALVDEITTEAEDLYDIVVAYNETDGADHDLVAEVVDIIDSVERVVTQQLGDLSGGFHDAPGIMADLNGAYVDLLNAKAYFYENTPPDTVTVTVTTTTTVTVPGGDTLLLVGGSVGGIVIGLILGVLVGRRR